MLKQAFYNDIDKNACAWMRELSDMDLITRGLVDERSITEINADDLAGYKRLHFFAGIGGWDYALQLSGWPDEWPVVTASLPCQPFSVAGKQFGKSDERHLLPHFIELVKRSDWPVIIGEQVPGAIKHGWLDDLQHHLGLEGYAVGAAVLTAAGAGTPHIRQRLYWVAIRESWLRNAIFDGLEGFNWNGGGNSRQKREETHKTRSTAKTGGYDGGLGDTEHDGHFAATLGRSVGEGENEGRMQQLERPNSDFTNCDWTYCRDKKYRPIKRGIAPLAYGIPERMGHGGDTGLSENETSEARVMRLKGYGNAIQIDTAVMFLKSVIDVLGIHNG